MGKSDAAAAETDFGTSSASTPPRPRTPGSAAGNSGGSQPPKHPPPHLLAPVLASAQRRGLLIPLVVCVPLLSMLSMLVTVAICLRWWRDRPDAPQNLIFPAISELGVEAPQRCVYQVGFALCGLLLSLGLLMFEELVAPELLQQERAELLLELFQQSAWWGHAAAAGVAIQGVVTLEHNISARCFVHWGGAILFILGAMRHAKASNELYDVAAKRKARLLQVPVVQRAHRLRHILLDYSSYVAFLIPLLMQALPGKPPESAAGSAEATDKVDFRMLNAMGLAQWVVVLQFAVYFCTYVLDLYAAATDRIERIGAGSGSGLGHPLRAAAAAAVAVPRAAAATAATAAAAAAATAACIKGPAFG